jgi:hypothetical protein
MLERSLTYRREPYKHATIQKFSKAGYLLALLGRQSLQE